MKAILKILLVVVSVTVITAWTYNINLDTTFRGGDATNMIEKQLPRISQSGLVTTKKNYAQNGDLLRKQGVIRKVYCVF